MRLIFIYSSSFVIHSFLLASLYIEIMGAKSSKAAVVIDPSKANIYDTFSNYQDATATDDVADDDHVDEHDDVCASEVMRTTSSTCSPG